MIFANRNEAGKKLAIKIEQAGYGDNAVVFALVRGGIVIGQEVSQYLKAPLDIILVRKIGFPGFDEYAIGAIAENDPPILNYSEVQYIESDKIEQIVHKERETIISRHKTYLNKTERISASGKTAIIVDDGIATGYTMQAAVQYIAKQRPKKIVVGVPVAAADSVQDIKNKVEKVIVVDDPVNFGGAVGAHYKSFSQITDKQVIDILKSRQF